MTRPRTTRTTTRHKAGLVGARRTGRGNIAALSRAATAGSRRHRSRRDRSRDRSGRERSRGCGSGRNNARRNGSGRNNARRNGSGRDNTGRDGTGRAGSGPGAARRARPLLLVAGGPAVRRHRPAQRCTIRQRAGVGRRRHGGTAAAG
jgi:hypothetical protein